MVKHHGQPIHHLGDLLQLIEEDAWQLATRKSRGHVQALGLDRAQVATMLLSLREADFRRPWHEGVTTEFGHIPADDYKLFFDDEKQMRCTPGVASACYYIKLAIYSDEEGDCCLIASFHLDGRP